MYVNNDNYNLVINTMTAYDIKAGDTGGVFMFEKIKTVTIAQQSVFERFGPGSYGTFMYSLWNTLELILRESTFKCLSSAPTYTTHI